MGEVHPRISAPPVGQSALRFGQIPTNAPPRPRGGGGGGGCIIDRCITLRCSLIANAFCGFSQQFGPLLLIVFKAIAMSGGGGGGG